MKKLTHIIACFLSLGAAVSCSMFELDSFEGPNAQVSGRFLDSKTGEQMGIESSVYSYWDWGSWSMKTESAGALVVSEDQNWLVRFDGKYRNNLVFAADYKVDTRYLPCYPPTNDNFTLKKGGNTVDFTVTPYCRIVNENISYNAAAKKIVATFQVELGDGTKANSIDNVAFCANTQVFVGCKFFNLAKDDPGAKRAGGFDWATWSSKPACQPGETVRLPWKSTSRNRRTPNCSSMTRTVMSVSPPRPVAITTTARPTTTSRRSIGFPPITRPSSPLCGRTNSLNT